MITFIVRFFIIGLFVSMVSTRMMQTTPYTLLQ